MMKSLAKKSTHVVKSAFPLSHDHIIAISAYLDCASNAPLCVKACVLLGYSCYLQSSNLLAQTSQLGEAPTRFLLNTLLLYRPV